MHKAFVVDRWDGRNGRLQMNHPVSGDFLAWEVLYWKMSMWVRRSVAFERGFALGHRAASLSQSSQQHMKGACGDGQTTISISTI